MAMNLISAMKERIKSSGTSKKDVFYVAADSKRRIRFLQELDTGYEFKFHTHWERGINALCCEHYHQDCPYCADTDENMKESTMYAWNVWDYDANKVVILLYKATGITPVPAFIEFFEEYGTICDRDYTIKKIGKGMSGNITVIPGEISKFRNGKAKPWNEKQIIKILKEAFPVNSEDAVDDDEDEEEMPKSKKNKNKAASQKKKKELTLEEKLAELDKSDLREIALQCGLSKKEIKPLDEDELIDLLVSDYDEDDLLELVESLADDEDDEEDEDDE